MTSTTMGTKIFVGNIPFDTTANELTDLFSQYGEVMKCDRLKQFAFVFMTNADEAQAAVDGLNSYRLHNMRISVQLSTKNTQGRGTSGNKSNSGGTTKIFVGNLPNGIASEKIVALFEKYGRVVQGDVLEGQGYGFVHMSDEEEAAQAIKALHGHNIDGKKITVEMSTNTQKKGRGGDRDSSRRSDRRDYGSQRYDPYHDYLPPSRRLPAPPSLSSVSSLLSDLNRASLQLQSASLISPSLQLLAPPTASSLGYSASGLDVEAALRRVPSFMNEAPLGLSRQPVAPAQPAVSSTQSNSGESFARELLKFYLKNPVGFDAYARDPLVRTALDLDDDREGMAGVGGAHNMSQSQAVMSLPTLSQSNGSGQQQHLQQQLMFHGGLGSRY